MPDRLSMSPSLLFEDGIFETLRSEKGKIVAVEEHIHRLFESAKSLDLSLGYSKESLKRLLNKEVASKPYPDAYIRIAFLREAKGSQLFLIVKQAKKYSRICYEKGISLRTSPTRRNLISSIDAQLKVRDYLNGLLSFLDGQVAGDGLEEIYLDAQGYVTEGTISNIFMAKDNALLTPPASLGVLKGITRDQAMAVARRSGIPVHERPFTRFNLYNADEVFLTNTSMGAMPVTAVDGRMIDDGKVGRITKLLIRALFTKKN